MNKFCFMILISFLSKPFEVEAFRAEVNRLKKNTPQQITGQDGKCRTVEITTDLDKFVPISKLDEITVNIGNLPNGVNISASCTGGSGTPLTYPGSSKGETDCTNDGGTVVNAGASTVCRFEGATCPSNGWSRAGNWYNTANNSRTFTTPAVNCSYTLGACHGYRPPNISIPSRSVTLSVSGAGWANQLPKETCEQINPASCTQNRWNECDLPETDNYFCTQGITYSVSQVERSWLTSSLSSELCGGSSGIVNNSEVMLCTKGFGPEGYAALKVGSYSADRTTQTVTAQILHVGCK